MICIASYNQWGIEGLNNGKWIPFHAIPPRQEGVDYIDCNGKYHFDYTGVVSHGVLIIIRDSKPELRLIPHFEVCRLKNYLK